MTRVALFFPQHQETARTASNVCRPDTSFRSPSCLQYHKKEHSWPLHWTPPSCEGSSSRDSGHFCLVERGSQRASPTPSFAELDHGLLRLFSSTLRHCSCVSGLLRQEIHHVDLFVNLPVHFSQRSLFAALQRTGKKENKEKKGEKGERRKGKQGRKGRERKRKG